MTDATEKGRDIVPTTRYLTGKSVHHGYVLDRAHGKFLVGCDHDHRSMARAELCAEAMTRAALGKAVAR